MIPLSLIQEIRRLIGTMSNRQIAKRVGVSRITVNRVVKGTYKVHQKKEGKRLCEQCGRPLPCIACARRLHDQRLREIAAGIRRPDW